MLQLDAKMPGINREYEVLYTCEMNESFLFFKSFSSLNGADKSAIQLVGRA